MRPGRDGRVSLEGSASAGAHEGIEGVAVDQPLVVLVPLNCKGQRCFVVNLVLGKQKLESLFGILSK